MRKLIIFLMLCLTPILSCTKSNTKPVLKGKVTGADGKAPLMAHAHLFALGDNPSESQQTVQMKPDGSFELELIKGQYNVLMLSAVNHQIVQIPLITDKENQNIEVDIILAAYDYNEDISGVKIVGDWNKFDFNTAEPMTPQDDGSFIYEREIAADTLVYQLINIEKTERSVNGTMSDYFRYDGGGDYRSVIKVQDGKARIVFDPSKLLKSKYQDLPKITFDDNNESLSEFFQISNRTEAETQKALKAVRRYFNEHGNTRGFKYDFSAIKNICLEKISQKENELLRKYAAIKLIELVNFGENIDSEIIQQINRFLHIDDPIWAASPFLIMDFYKRVSDEKKATQLFEENLSKISVKKVRAAALIGIGLNAKMERNNDKLNKIYAELKTNYTDMPPQVQFYINLLNPKKKISTGNPLPDFEVKLLDSGKTISKKSLLGKYYLMDFWAVWCGPCVGEMPKLHAAYEKFKGANFEILSLSLDQSLENVKDFRNNKWKMPWMNVFLEGDTKNEITQAFDVMSIPKPILVNPEGMIIATSPDLRGDDLEKTLAKYLKK